MTRRYEGKIFPAALPRVSGSNQKPGYHPKQKMKSSLLQFESRSSKRENGAFNKGRRAFPLTDYHYHATAEAPLTATAASPGVETTVHAAEMRSLRKLSMTVLESESRWQFGLEATALAIVGAISAWALIPAVTLMSQYAYRW